MPLNDSDVIYRYTRAQALDDGVLVNLTEWAKETGFVIPVACTATVWHRYLSPPTGVEGCGQSLRGRAHDLLWMLYRAIKRQAAGASVIQFETIFLMAPKKRETVEFKCVCGPGDDAEPVLTIMLPHED